MLQTRKEFQMTDHFIVSNFDVESESYEAFSKIKNQLPSKESKVKELVLLQKNTEGTYQVVESLNLNENTIDDTQKGGLIGMVLGLFTGPFNWLLFGSLGALIGSAIDLDDQNQNISALEQVAAKTQKPGMTLIALVEEENNQIIDQTLHAYQVDTTRFDAAAIAEEVEHAEEVAKQAQEEAQAKLHEKRSEERKQKFEEWKKKISDGFDNLTQKL